MGIFDKFGRKKKIPYTDAEVLAQAKKFAEERNAPKIPFPSTIPVEVTKKLHNRIATDLEFRDLLDTDPDKALADFELTDEQFSDLKEYFRKQHEATRHWLEREISRYVM